VEMSLGGRKVEGGFLGEPAEKKGGRSVPKGSGTYGGYNQ